ncbi:MAG: HAD hydrolase-like protein [archaeon]
MKKLIVFDMDGIIFEHFNFWLELHKAYNTYEEGIILTKKYLKTDYQKLVDEVIGRLWKGKSSSIYFDLIKKANYVKGAKETLKELKNKGYKIGIVSSGPSDLAERAKKECKIDYYFTNKLLIKNGKITGSKDIKYWPIRHGSKKDPLKEICKLSNTKIKDSIVVIHEDSDLEMAQEAGFVIGFNPSKEIKTYCKVIIKGDDLREILKYV